MNKKTLKILRSMISLYRSSGKTEQAFGKETTNVLFLIRNRTWISWEILILFQLRKLGQQSILIYSAADINKVFGKLSVFVLSILKSASKAAYNIDSEMNRELHPDSEILIDRQIAYDFRIEEEYVSELENLEELRSKYRRDNSAMLHALDRVGADRNHSFWLYSGIIGLTSVVRTFCERREIPFCTFEGWSLKPGLMIYGINTCALEFKFREKYNYDILHNREMLDSFIEQYRNFIEGREVSGWFSEFYNFQRGASIDDLPEKFRNWAAERTGGDNSCVLIATNMIGDSATLGRERNFESQKEWLVQTIDFLLKETNANIIIRVHPAEYWQRAKVKVKMGNAILQFKEEFDRRIYLIPSEEKFNTMSLASFCNFILVWTSSVGADFASRGIPSMNCAIGNYEDFDFSVSPASTEKYWKNLREMVENPELYRLSEEQIYQAQAFFYYLFKGDSRIVFGPDYDLSGAELGGALKEFVIELQEKMQVPA